ncbi:MAG: hypothetical protein QGF67_06440 [Lentisphaeria bacterium]|jgi:predicted dehydrogenase|nr:hypothetical protein [Lentisphaeria bacterium]MDP7741058.1 hypothetical protein [Lentisphaeria bacterium]
MAGHPRIAIVGTRWWSSTAHFPAIAAPITAIRDSREEVPATAAAKVGADSLY